MDVLNCTPEQWYEQENKWLEFLNTDNVWDQIPLLNVNDLHNLKDSKLIRFRGMIQDMHGPEFYLEKFEVKNEDTQQTTLQVGKYIDVLNSKDNEIINLEGANNVTGERQTYVAISVPALNAWVKDIEINRFKIAPNTNALSNTPSTSGISESGPVKRPVDNMEVDESHSTDQESCVNKRQCVRRGVNEARNTVSQKHLLNFPIPDPSGKVCHLKIYKNFDLLKLNAVCEFVGFLSVDPTLASENTIEEGMDEVEFQVHHPPPSLIPRIHCVTFKDLTHNNPLLREEKFTLDRLQFLRKELLILFTQLLFGDALAAEYLIYHLISEVYLRKDFMAVGKFCLNFSNIPKIEHVDYVQELYRFIEMLTTKSHYLAMSLENMNSLTFIPKKDYASNRLTSSILQLSSNTHLVLDETKLTAGKLNEAGVHGVKTIANAIKNQKIMYDFTYYQLEFECDIPFLIFSEGKSMLPSDVHVILEPDEMHISTCNEIFEAAKHFLKPELLNELRVYLTAVRLTTYEITDDIKELVQNEFANMRQKSNVTGDDLHQLLVLARLVCISMGKNTLDEECWKKACSLEDDRKHRIKEATESK